MPDSGNVGWVEGVWAAGVAIMSGFWLMINTKLSKESFKMYVQAQEKLMDSYVKNTDANTRTIEKIYEKLDGKQDKKK